MAARLALARRRRPDFSTEPAAAGLEPANPVVAPTLPVPAAAAPEPAQAAVLPAAGRRLPLVSRLLPQRPFVPAVPVLRRKRRGLFGARR